MNRRSFFGFACGGVVAAPVALLVGEKASGFPKAAAMPAKDAIRDWGTHIEVQVDSANGDARIRQLVQERVQKALAEQRTFAHRKGR
ncbi:hypothetical protein I7G00_12735 [Sinorhizobium meliloti]|uniref:hypothetical protein n=1 Tax=Rhizobium meliloti TaxID=382 RepID=UPI000FD3C655|nr:hypothetical protein [Sinorhizobium meliloti]MDE3784911.1 hypothetical protein [Sinorhizobium meliloti]RVH99182.1 hypothetical protein CN206_33120 [Sinorhizobium meliloti]